MGNEARAKPADYDISDITPCSHEEADSRMFLHLAHAVSKGHKAFFMRGNDTDVVSNAVFATASLGEVVEDVVAISL